MVEHSRPNKLIKIDKHTNKVLLPSILLETRSGKVLGKISNYDKFSMSMVAIGVDEVTFDVHKYVDGVRCSIWDDLVDLKIIELQGYGRFQISVSYTDNTQTVKSVQGQSLEVELGQLTLNNFHINDEEDADMQQDEHTAHKYDSKGNFIPVVFYNKDNPNRSLLHLVLKDKAPHWSIGHVPTYVSRSEADDINAELSNKFKRVYTEDGTSIYDFLTGTVAEETNVVFTFDTLNRVINCYNLFECKIDGKIVGNPSADVIGEDTLVFGSKKNFVNEVSIESNEDQVKNCFRVEGGDDIITAMVAAINMTGDNYIWKIAPFQMSDMSQDLKDCIESYQKKMTDDKGLYYGENGIYTRLCEAYEQLHLKESTLMPSLTTVEVGEAKTQYDNVVNGLKNTKVYVSNINNWSTDYCSGVTNNVEAYAMILMDSRYDIEIIKDSIYYIKNANGTGTWKGKIRIKQNTDDTNVYPVATDDELPIITVQIGNGYKTVHDDGTETNVDGELEFMRQKVEKALAKNDLQNVTFNLTDSDEIIKKYFDQFALNRLESFYSAYDGACSILSDYGSESYQDSDIRKDLYNKYYRIKTLLKTSDEELKKNKATESDIKSGIYGVLNKRELEVEEIENTITLIEEEQKDFLKTHDFYNLLVTEKGEDRAKELYKEFYSYRREDTYKNDNYNSDNATTTAEQLERAKELMEVAQDELDKACMLQRTVSTSLSNLLVMKEFEPLYDSFALFNYIRIETDDEVLKLRLIGVEFNGDSIEEISVTFSEQVESINRTVSDLENLYGQMSSIATSFPTTTRQASKGEKANKQYIDTYTNGIDASKTFIKNNDNNVVTINGSGIIAKRTDDEGYFGDKMVIINGNGMYLSDNGLKSLKMAAGEIIYTNPITNKSERKYGIIAETIVGQLIAGNNMYIGNESGSVQITGDGIDIYNKLKEKIFYADNEGNLTLKGTIYADGGEFGGSLTSNSIYLNPNSTTNNMGLIRLTTLEERGGDEYNTLSIINNYASDTENLAISFGFKNTNTTNFYYTAGMAIVKKNGSIFNQLYSNTYLGDDESSFIGKSTDTYNGLYASNAIHTPRVFAGNHVHGDYALDVNGESYFNDKINFNNGYFLNSLHYKNEDGSKTQLGIYCSGQFNTEGKVSVGNTTYNGYMLSVNGSAFINGEVKTPGWITSYTSGYDSSGKPNESRIIVSNVVQQGRLTCTSGNNFGVFSDTYGEWLIRINNGGEVLCGGTSDSRLKNSIEDTKVDDALEQILAIKHKEFYFNKSNKFYDNGYIAQELEKINPNMVIPPDEEQTYYSVNTFYMESIITKAIQEFYNEFSDKFDELKQENIELKQKIKELKGEN